MWFYLERGGARASILNGGSGDGGGLLSSSTWCGWHNAILNWTLRDFPRLEGRAWIPEVVADWMPCTWHWAWTSRLGRETTASMSPSAHSSRLMPLRTQWPNSYCNTLRCQASSSVHKTCHSTRLLNEALQLDSEKKKTRPTAFHAAFVALKYHRIQWASREKKG